MIGNGRQAPPVARAGLKKVAVKQLRPGMYVEQLCCSWIDTPFWQSSFLIESAAQLERIATSRAVEAWIDTGRGLDVEPAPETNAFRFRPAPRATMADELGRAAVLLDQSKRALFDMFNEARMGCAVEVRDAMPMVESIAASVLRNPGALIGLARLKTADNYTYMHSVAVCALMIALARQLGLDDHLARELGLAGLLHDVGKMAVPAEVLNKPGRLTEDEFCVVRSHPAKGPVVTPFVKCLSIYPVGTLVSLQSGRLGVVSQQPCGNHCCCPRSRVFSPPGTGLNRERKLLIDENRQPPSIR
jgi:putative nucleotidyltransferase with HDIG domain